MIETQFGNALPDDKIRNEHKKGSSSQEPSTQYIQIIDSKKSQNISILLRALNVITEQVCNALQEGSNILLFYLFIYVYKLHSAKFMRGYCLGTRLLVLLIAT